MPNVVMLNVMAPLEVVKYERSCQHKWNWSSEDEKREYIQTGDYRGGGGTLKSHHGQTLANRMKPGPSFQLQKWPCACSAFSL
jgi:hypothetical protein